jgi:hypothetical protein
VPYDPKGVSESLAQFSAGLTTYLGYLGLPAEVVLVDASERRKVINNLPDVVAVLSEEQRQRAMYLSKFVAACGVGLFDAALNYLWDETIRNIREKVARFDLDYFYDCVVTDAARRAKLRGPDDLAKIEDWELIKGSLDSGIITEIGYKHLDYIRQMRNHASAAHPNQNDLTGFQLVAWLETCIKEVLAKDPGGPVLEVRRLLRNLRQHALLPAEAPAIIEATKLLPDDLLLSLTRAVVGMYTDPALDAQVRTNIKQIAVGLWEAAPDDAKSEVGLKQATLSANGDVARARLAREFLELVNGLSFLPPEALAVEMSTTIDGLFSAHHGWSNFAAEVPWARALRKLIPANGDIPRSVEGKYAKTVVLCRIGNPHGVSNASVDYLDGMIRLWQDRQIHIFLKLPYLPDFANRLMYPACARRFAEIATRLKPQAVNAGFRTALEFIETYPQNAMERIAADTRYQRIVKR